MSQVIEVRFIHTTTQEVLTDRMTAASSHREAVELALSAWSGGVGVLVDMEPVGEGEFLNRSTPCWRYHYICTLQDDEYDREVLAQLFTQYKEKPSAKV